MTETVQKIEAILAEVSANWLAADGGLTMAASDALHAGRNIIRRIQANDAAWCWGLDASSASTGAEVEIIDLAHDWARGKIRRQVEDRLRKDNRFLEAVIELHHNS